MSRSLIFGTLDEAFGLVSPPDLGGYPEEEIPMSDRAVKEAVRALSTKIASALFAGGVPASMVGVQRMSISPPVIDVAVIGRKLGQIPTSALDLVGVNVNGAVAQVSAMAITEKEFAHFKSPSPSSPERTNYGTTAIPAVIFSVGPIENLSRSRFRMPAAY